ncbi:hypothetical protein JCM9279_005677 [Rhodotorula babjevae]
MPARSHDYLSDRGVVALSIAVFAANAFLLAPSNGLGFLAVSLLLVAVNCAAVEVAYIADGRKLAVPQAVSISAIILVVLLGFLLLITSHEAERVRDKVYPIGLALHIFVTFLIMRCTMAEEAAAAARADRASAAEEGRAAGAGAEASGSDAGRVGAAAAAADGASDDWAGEVSGQHAKAGFFSSAPPAPPGYAAVPSAEQ